PVSILNRSSLRLILGQSKLLITFIESGRVSRDFTLQYRKHHLSSPQLKSSRRHSVSQLFGHDHRWRLCKTAPCFLFGSAFLVEPATFFEAAKMASVLIKCDYPLLEQLPSFG